MHGRYGVHDDLDGLLSREFLYLWQVEARC
jgi:hypothetical protein